MNAHVIETRNLERQYVLKGETVHALSNVSLTVAPSEFMAVAGPSGSGKSTFLNLIGGLDSPTAGEVSVEGRSLSKLSSTDLARLRRDRM